MPGIITSLRSKYLTFSYQSWQADNQLAGKSLSHMQTLGYQCKMCLKYVITRDYLRCFGLLPEALTRDPNISPRAENGQGLILRAITKTL